MSSLLTALIAVICAALVVPTHRAPTPSEAACSGGHCVTVTPDGDSQSKDAGSWFLSSLTVTNNGNYTENYEYGHSCSGGAQCQVLTTPPATMTPGQWGIYKLAVTMGTANSNVRVWAMGGGVQDSGWRYYAVIPVVTITAPALTSDTTAVVYSRMPLVQATFLPNDAGLDTASLVVVVGTDTVTKFTRFNRGLVEWELDSLRQLTPGVLKKFSVRICHTNGQCKTATRYLKLDNSGKPFVSFQGMPLEALGRQPGAPLGPGIAVSGADVETGFAVPSYVAMGASRSAGLVYSTRTSHPRALINTDVELTWPAGTPDQIKAVLIDGSTRMDSVVLSSPSCTAAVGNRCRIALQGDFGGSSFGTPTRKWLKVEVSVTSSGTTKTTTDSVEAVLVDRRTGHYGNGWAVAGVLQLVQAGNDRLIVGPNGQATIYRGNAGLYLSPPGDYSVLVDSSSNFTLRFRDGSRIAFNSDGWQSQARDASGNVTTIAYAAVGRVWTITDPTSHAFTFSYDGSNKLTTITDPGSRQSKVTIDGSNYLTYDSLSSPAANSHVATYSYTSSGSNGAIVLSTRTDALGSTTTVGYSGRYRPTQATLPAVLPETGGSTQSPLIAYVPQETRALGTLISADSVYALATDPLGNWTRSALNRWGEPVRAWDVLGTMSRASYNAAGFVIWSEGKVADSTRIWSDYDALGRLVRSYQKKSASVTIRVDSLVWDASHNLTQRVDPRGKVSRFGYDGYHRVIWAATPNNDTSRTWYRSDGLPDSTRAPGQSTSTRYVYDNTWKNLQTVTNAAGVVTASITVDSWGRTTSSQRRIPIQGGSSTVYQWRRTLTGYNAANAVDSSRFERTNNCTPCTSPPSWPGSGDSAQFQQVRYRYDRLGRTLARYDTQRDSNVYTFDALGRVRTHMRPRLYPTPDDSFRYDLAGRLRHAWNRRGIQISHFYDSRNRDTMTTVPGVGDIRRSFSGPNDELSRSWIANYLDSIGGVNPEVRWVYSQAGRLLSDTAQGSRVTQYAVDFYGRDSVTTDVVGAWKLRYEANRGALDTIITPWNDTLSYTFNALQELTGPTLRSGSNTALARAVTYQTIGAVASVSNTSGYNAGYYYPDAEPTQSALARHWEQQQGSGGATTDYTDSLAYDGWERMTRFLSYRNDTLIAADTFSFDYAGNIIRNGESRGYVKKSDLLVTRGDHSYGYDANNNLTGWGVPGGSNWTYSYDGLDRLVAVRYGATLVARYAYDVLGRRIARRVYNAGPNNAPTEYVRMLYRGGQVTAEADSGGTLTLSYSWGLGPDDLTAIHRYSDNLHLYVVQDNVHSVRGLVRRDGSATWQSYRRYGPYGAQQDSAGTDSLRLRYRWIGRELDPETGFYYIRARYYDPAAMRFTQEDPIGYAGGSNLYAYGDGNPTAGRDINGSDMDYDYYVSMRPVRGDPMGDGAADPFAEGEWGSWLQGGGGFAGSMFTAWDFMSQLERTSTGDMQFFTLNDDGSYVYDAKAREAYLQLKKAAYTNGNAELQSMLALAERSSVDVITHEHLGGGKTSYNPDRIGFGHDWVRSLGIPSGVSMAHELGHLMYKRWGRRGVQMLGVRNEEESGTAFAAIHYENLARQAFGCRLRDHDYKAMFPQCR